MSAFWDAWRKDIIRGAALFVAVLAVGLCVRYLVVRVRQGVTDRLPMALRDLRDNFDPELLAGARDTGEAWTYRAKILPNQWVWVRNTNGSVKVEAGKGDSLEVRAVKTYRRSDPASVRLVAVPYEGGVSICAVWKHGEGGCGPGEEVKQGSAHGSDVAVAFTVRLPRRVRVGATTVNGGVHVLGASAPIVARTVSGDVDIETSAGPVSAASVNGGVRVRMRTFGDTGAVSLFTVNGPVTAELPARLDAEVDASTVNGSIDTDYPLSVTGKYVSHKLHGTVGSGGRVVHITTVNGSINLKKAS
ncbi:MAG TPA: DUF4097 family beta strand repeat-containing protein [Gemmatimonadales bacterium]|nr:DUF4097 family beta strand repeat-containing protein [Gemmatimonadales bacterium]